MYRSTPPHLTDAARHFARAREHSSDACWAATLGFLFVLAAYREAVTSDGWGMVTALVGAAAFLGLAWKSAFSKWDAERRGREAMGGR